MKIINRKEILETLDRLRSAALKESYWLYTAISITVALVVIMMPLTAISAITSSNSAKLNVRLDNIYKVSLLFIAIITFCTIVWRGLVSTRQVAAQVEATNHQAHQISLVREQNQRGHKNELAGLLQKGAELLASEQKSYRIAGVATLRAVAIEESDFAPQAFTLIAEHLEDLGNKDFNSNEFANCLSVVNDISSITETLADYYIRIRVDSNQRIYARDLIRGVENASYEGGRFLGNRNAIFGASDSNYEFKSTRFIRGNYHVSGRVFSNCRFRNCKIAFLNNNYGDDANNFEDCDFSGATIETFDHQNILGSGNYYFDDTPPTDRKGNALPEQWLERNFEIRASDVASN